MQQTAHRLVHPAGNPRGGVLVLVLIVCLLLVAAGGGGILAYVKWFKAPPLRSQLASIQLKTELIHFSNDHICPALYHNLIAVDDVLVMMDKELDRLERIGRQFPDQTHIISPQRDQIGAGRRRLSEALVATSRSIERIYVTWLVDRKRGIEQIRSQKGSLTQRLADAMRQEATKISQIKRNPLAAS